MENSEQTELQLLVPPASKYTFDEKRNFTIECAYPYMEYFVNCVIGLPCNQYIFQGKTEFFDQNTGVESVRDTFSLCPPACRILGGAAFEILNQSYPGVDLFRYSDPTSDVDVKLLPPRLTRSPSGFEEVYSFNSSSGLTAFYRHFSTWAFDSFLQQVQALPDSVKQLRNAIPFDLAEYDDIPASHKTDELCFLSSAMGVWHVVGFVNEDKTMYKVQLVCKVQRENLSVIDHLIEIIIPLSLVDAASGEFNPTHVGFANQAGELVRWRGRDVYIDGFQKIIYSNMDAYMERRNVVGTENESKLYKAINHVARMLYLFELFYQNQDKFDLKSQPLLLVYTPTLLKKLVTFVYYKVVDGKYIPIKIGVRTFQNAYVEIVAKNEYLFRSIQHIRPDYFFVNPGEANAARTLHDDFLAKLFNQETFAANKFTLSILPMQPAASAAGGATRRKRSKKRKSRRVGRGA